MNGLLLMPRLLVRTSTILVMVWSGMLVLALERPRLMLSIPLFLGFIVGQANIEARSRFFSWSLPNLRRDLVISMTALGILCAGCSVWLAPAGVPLQVAALHGFTAFFLGTIIKLQEYTVVYVKSLLSWICWVLLIAWVVGLRDFVAWYARDPLGVSLLFSGLSLAILWYHLHPEPHRELCFAPMMTLSSSWNKTAREWYQRKVQLNKSTVVKNRHYDFPTAPRWSDWIRAGYFESLGGYGLWLPLRMVGLMVMFIAIANTIIEHSLNVTFMMVAMVGCFQWPMMPRMTLLYPIDRRQWLRISYVSALAEMLLYTGSSAIALLLFELPGLHLPFQPPGASEVQRVLMMALTVVPIVQAVRRCFGCNMKIIMTVWISLAVGIEVFSVWMFRHNRHFSFTEFAVFLVLIALAQLGLYLSLRRHFLRGDLNPIP